MPHGLHHVFARVVARLTYIGADAAMFMHGGVTSALFRAGAAGLRASRKLRLQRLRACASEAKQDRSGGLADVGTVEVKPDTCCKLRNMRLRQTGIRADKASLNAGEAGPGAA